MEKTEGPGGCMAPLVWLIPDWPKSRTLHVEPQSSSDQNQIICKNQI